MAGIIAGNSPVLGPRGSAAADGHTILTCTDSGFGTVRVTTAAPHGINSPEGEVSVVIAGTGLYDGTVFVSTAEDIPDQFLIQDSTYISDTTGGTWALA